MTRRIVLDTETTGLDPAQGHRVIEIGCVELRGRQLTESRFHTYINPERDIDAGAMQVHGITNERVASEPLFAAIAEEFIAFIRGAELVIHNAAFDVGFLDAEFGLLGLGKVTEVCAGVTDTLKMARELRPGKRNSLDALCKDFGIDNSGRQLHGALLDAELLAEVYLAMTRGQESLMMDLDAPAAAAVVQPAGKRAPLRVLRASDAELAEHERVLQEIAKQSKGKCLWLSEAAG
ncbi:MAG: DNA polymerase III subunit epsilon [Rhodocyclaceae bacterium]|nr:DNA polymerase III subunit epsilon [Rhodocyclaceae bacterium]